MAEPAAEPEGLANFDNQVALLIAILALILAVTSVAGSNAGKDTMLNQMQASDTYAFYQAKNIRRNATLLAKDQLELELATSGATWTAEARAAAHAKIAHYEQEADRYQNEEKDGMKALREKAEGHAAARDLAMLRDPNFDFAEGFLQIAIVIASIAIILKSRKLFVAAGGIGAMGAVLCANGFLLLF